MKYLLERFLQKTICSKPVTFAGLLHNTKKGWTPASGRAKTPPGVSDDNGPFFILVL
jgi:hypothetical protein